MFTIFPGDRINSICLFSPSGKFHNQGRDVKSGKAAQSKGICRRLSATECLHPKKAHFQGSRKNDHQKVFLNLLLPLSEASGVIQS
jgi:hypothetical protein